MGCVYKLVEDNSIFPIHIYCMIFAQTKEIDNFLSGSVDIKL